MNLDSPIPSVTPSSNHLTAQSVSVPSSSCHAVEPYELPDNDQELSETDVSLIILLAQAKEFNEAGFYNTLVRRFYCTPGEAYLLTWMAAASRGASTG
jgi:hypothetical protein